MDKSEINALIKLLDDTDEEIYNHIEGKILSYGKEIIPFLEDAWGYSFDATLQQRIVEIIHKIQFDLLKTELLNWSKSEDQNLLTGATLLSRYQYPDLDEVKLNQQLEKIKRDVWLELNDNLTALEKVKVINHILFEVHGFSGNTTNFHSPQNSFINQVLDTKKGNPLSLSIIYSLIAQRLDIPIYGVNLPEHFILAYVDTDVLPTQPQDLKADILFYINPFSKGSVFDRKEIDVFLKQLKIVPEESFFSPCSNLLIIQRAIRNLIYSYKKAGNIENSEELKILMKTINGAY